MAKINLQWQLYLIDNSYYKDLQSNLLRLTRCFINQRYACFNNHWKDIFQDLQIKIIQKKEEIISGHSINIKNFQAWYYRVMKNYLINLATKSKREKLKLNNYLILQNEGEQNMHQSEEEILLKFAKIMAIQNNKEHVDIFIDFVKGKTYQEIATKHNVTNENARKIVERMRRECRKLWETDKVQVFIEFIAVSIREAQTLFGKKKEEAILSLIKRLIGEIPKEYKEYLIKSLA